VVATFPGTIPVAEPQISAMAAARGLDVEIFSTVAPEAFKAMNAGDVATHDLTSPTAAVRRLRALLG